MSDSLPPAASEYVTKSRRIEQLEAENARLRQALGEFYRLAASHNLTNHPLVKKVRDIAGVE